MTVDLNNCDLTMTNNHECMDLSLTGIHLAEVSLFMFHNNWGVLYR